MDQAKIDGAALILCAEYCPEARKGGTCETLCEAARDATVWNCKHLQRLRNLAARVFDAQPAQAPAPAGKRKSPVTSMAVKT